MSDGNEIEIKGKVVDSTRLGLGPPDASPQSSTSKRLWKALSSPVLLMAYCKELAYMLMAGSEGDFDFSKFPKLDVEVSLDVNNPPNFDLDVNVELESSTLSDREKAGFTAMAANAGAGTFGVKRHMKESKEKEQATIDNEGACAVECLYGKENTDFRKVFEKKEGEQEEHGLLGRMLRPWKYPVRTASTAMLYSAACSIGSGINTLNEDMAAGATMEGTSEIAMGVFRATAHSMVVLSSRYKPREDELEDFMVGFSNSREQGTVARSTKAYNAVISAASNVTDNPRRAGSFLLMGAAGAAVAMGLAELVPAVIAAGSISPDMTNPGLDIASTIGEVASITSDDDVRSGFANIMSGALIILGNMYMSKTTKNKTPKNQEYFSCHPQEFLEKIVNGMEERPDIDIIGKFIENEEWQPVVDLAFTAINKDLQKHPELREKLQENDHWRVITDKALEYIAEQAPGKFSADVRKKCESDPDCSAERT